MLFQRPLLDFRISNVVDLHLYNGLRQAILPIRQDLEESVARAESKVPLDIFESPRARFYLFLYRYSMLILNC